MPSTTQSHAKWLSITTAIIISGGILYLTLTAITAYATRSLIQAQFDTSNQQQIVQLHDLNGSFNWSHLKFGVGVTAIEIDTKMQHWGITTYIQGQVLDNKISSTPLATFTGYIDSKLWNGNVQFDIQGHAPELNYNGFPVFHATALTLKSTGTLIYKNNKLDTMLNITSDSNYGPLRFEANLLIPNHNLAEFWHTGYMQLRAILPARLWGLVQQLNPILARSLTNKGMIKQQAEVAIIDIMVRDGNWQTLVKN